MRVYCDYTGAGVDCVGVGYADDNVAGARVGEYVGVDMDDTTGGYGIDCNGCDVSVDYIVDGYDVDCILGAMTMMTMITASMVVMLVMMAWFMITMVLLRTTWIMWCIMVMLFRIFMVTIRFIVIRMWAMMVIMLHHHRPHNHQQPHPHHRYTCDKQHSRHNQ